MSMPTCPSCIYAQGICKKTGVKIHHSTGCTYHKPKPMTNADSIRAMTDEELAVLFNGWIADCDCNDVPCRNYCVPNSTDCKKNWLDWLKQEVTE